MSGFGDEITNNCATLFYKISTENKNLIVCLRIYINELNNIFITVPNSIFLLYDKTSEQSFDIISSYYEKLIRNKKYENIKYVFVGNKKDLIKEENENDTEINEEEKNENIDNENKNKDLIINNIIDNENKKDDNKEEEIKIENENNKIKEEINENKINENEIKEIENKEEGIKEKENIEENKINEEDKKENENEENNIIKNNVKDNDENNIGFTDKRNKSITFSNKIKKYCKEKKIVLHKEISGLTGEGVMQLCENIISLLFNDIKNMEENAKEFDVNLSFYKNIETELNLSSAGQSYHSDDYKKEINKINKKRNGFFWCFRCSIF